MAEFSLRQLQVVAAIHRSGKIVHASQQLGLTQPAVSLQLQEAESRAGTPLFHRTPDGMRPTAAVLAVIDDTQAQLTLELKQAEEREAELNALNDINIRDAINSERSANAEAEAYKELRREGATPYWEMEKKILEADRAKLRIELAESEQKIAKVQYLAKKTERQLAEHDLTRRHVVAPFGGYIESRIAQLGEWVQPGSPILQLVRLDMLRIEGDIDALSYPGQVTVGTPAKVWIYANADGKADRAQAIQLDAKIGFVSSEIDLNNRYRIWVEVKNERRGDNWVIKPGMEADVTVIPGGTAN